MYDQAGSTNYNAAPEVTETVNAQKAAQTISVTTHAPGSAVFNSQFTVAATGGGSGNPVTFSSSGGCSNTGATFTMTSGTTTCTVMYDQAGSTNYNAAPEVTETVNAQKAAQTISVTTHAPGSAVFNSQFTVAANAPGGTVAYSSSGSCSNSGATFTMTSASGTCTVMYDQSGSANYNAAPEVTESVTAQKASQAITVTTHAPGSAAYGSQFTVAATGGGSGNPVTFSSAGGCSNSGATFTMTSGTTACQVMYDQTGSANYNAAPEATESVTATKAAQAITVTTHAPSTGVFNSQFTVAATGGGSGNAIAYSSSGSCSNSGATFTMTSASGTCTVMYDQSGSANYNAAPEVTESVTATKAAQAITVTTHAPGSAAYGSQFTVAATGGGSGNAIAYSSSGSCSNSGATFTVTSASGTCSVMYDQSGSANYNAAPEVTETVNAQKAAQTITITTHAPASAVFNSQFTVAATGGGSGNPVTFSSGGGCSNTGATFTMTSGTTTCTVMYDQAGSANYSAATTVTESANAQKADQTITVTTHAPATAGYGTSFSVAAGGPGGLVTFSSAGICLNIGDTFTMMSASGNCTVIYDQAGNSNYNAAPEVTETVAAQKADQTITVTTHAPTSAGDGTNFNVAATAPGGAVVYSSGGSCSNSGATFTMTSASGTCTVNYDQAGNSDYNAAPELTDSVTAGKIDQSISVNTHAPSSAAYGSQFTVAATAPGGAVTYSSSGSCSNNGATFTMTSGSGACTVSYDQAGNGSYNAAPELTETVNASKASQSIAVITHAPTGAVYGSQFAVAASAPAGAVVYSSAGSCSHTGATFTMTSGTGTCTVVYDQAGNSNYNAAPEVTETVNASKAPQSISVTTHAPQRAVDASQFTVAASAPGGPVTYSSDGSCTNGGATFTTTSASGTCTVKYDQAGGGNYSAAPEVTETVSARAAFGGFQAPLPNSALKAGSKTTVKFTLTDASGHPLPAAAASALATQVILSGPNGTATQLASALCTWVTKGQFFQCNLKIPSGLATGTTNPYGLTTMQNVGGQYVLAPPYTNAASDANPETIFLQGSGPLLPRITLSTHVRKRQPRHGRFLHAQISLAVRMAPATAGEVLRITIQRRKHGAWRTVSRRSRPLSPHDAAKISVKTSHTGRYRARASFAGDQTHAFARSRWRRFRVR
jgi:hypothetical protein